MPKLRVHAMAMSLDGYVAGPDQNLEHPLGVGGPRLHEWVFETRTGREMMGEPGGSTGVDDAAVAAGFAGIGATVMGRNMFGPVRGSWGSGPWGDDWHGWWGDDPPYHHPVFVLTHHRAPADRDAGRHHVPLRHRRHRVGVGPGVRGGRRCRRPPRWGCGDGPASICARGLVDELHVAIVPVLLGGGERLFDALGDVVDGYECAELVAGESVVHARVVRTADECSGAEGVAVVIDLVELVGVERRARERAEQERADHAEADAQADPHVPLGLVADRDRGHEQEDRRSRSAAPRGSR